MQLPSNAREISFGGETLWLDPAGAVYLPDYETLVVADLHLEKGSALSRLGAPLPLYDSQDTLTRLEGLLGSYTPLQLVLLGDSFHDAKAWQRLPETERARLMAMVAQLPDWWWVAGNHDAKLAGLLPGRHCTQLQVGGVFLAHQPVDGLAPLIVGHYHPKTTRWVGGAKISGKVFLFDKHLMILPAFGSYTGGLETSQEVYKHLLNQARQFIIYCGRLWQV